MTETNRRLFLGALALGAGGLASAQSLAAADDGHAAGYDVAPSTKYQPLIPRRPGDPVVFTASLDNGPIKATSGGWAREVTLRTLPISTGIAGAHLYLNPGGSREMHWHNSAEWAYVVDGNCQVTVVDPAGSLEVVNLGPGDLWYFPNGHSHAIQTLGNKPCHGILAFDDGLYSEHGTFGLSDWMSRFDEDALAQAFGVPKELVPQHPKGETYIMQGEVVALDGPEARATKELDAASSHRYSLIAKGPAVGTLGGTLHIASAREFPMSSTMTGLVMRLKPGAMHQPHWHPDANEWHYVLKGRTRVTLFAPDKRMAVAELSAGDCAYLPRGCGHSVHNIGSETCEIVGVLDKGEYAEASLVDWVAKAPLHLLANNVGTQEAALAAVRKPKTVITSPT
jgi:oxalate decarboxylase